MFSCRNKKCLWCLSEIKFFFYLYYMKKPSTMPVRKWLMMLVESESRRCRFHLFAYHSLFAQRKALKCWKLNMFTTELEWNMTWIYFVLDSTFKHLILYPHLSIYKSLWSCFQNYKNLEIQSLIRVNWWFFVFFFLAFWLYSSW